MGQSVFLGMSGGVDSSVSALLLQQAGYDVSGVNLRLFHNEDLGECREKTCCSLADAEDARAVAARLGIPFYVFDFSQVFRSTVIADFISEYEAGRTPNPCAECNRSVKFGALLQRALALHGEFLATGHYARVERDETTGRWLLKRGVDRSKDQSYFLYMLTQDQLSRTLFPLGALHKTEVREIAEQNGLVNAKKRDSQDICFAPDGDYVSFIQRTTGHPSPTGDFVDQEGKLLGRHKGFVRYTRGQHKGLGLSIEPPLYVLDKDPSTGTIRLGPDSALWTRVLTAENMNWISVPTITKPLRVTAKTRYSQQESAATAEALEGGSLRLTFDMPQRAVTSGQAVVLYDGETVVGGGTIVQ
ncbi:tRNA 2-thiouridine(34) synthase MnmA [Oscillibacter sp.]|uniref:tRNA 2-thiouridine(34) synthase MnmA n=1 Tax=Oscillibacter sp. TaxID=1945593 RepID=UPI002897B02E|nr:tRNA 2-thiouridine(34) synthase MnmA [Oscillibacter sp.]